jgi:hypothetical protein
MTALGIALIVAGLTDPCLRQHDLPSVQKDEPFRREEPPPSQDSFEETLERADRHLDEMPRGNGEAAKDQLAPTEHVPKDREGRDE